MKNKKQYYNYKMHIDPNEIMTEEQLHKELYGERSLTPFENIGLELSYGYFNSWLVLIITIITLIVGVLIGSLDASRRFNLPLSEVLSLSPAKSELAIDSVDYSRENTLSDDISETGNTFPEKINLDGFNGTVNVYYGNVQIGDIIEGSYSSYLNKDNQYVDIIPDDFTDVDNHDTSKKSENNTDYETIDSLQESSLIKKDDSTIINNPNEEIQDYIEPYSILNEDITYNGHNRQIILNIDKVSNYDTTPESCSDNKIITIGASDQGAEDNTEVSGKSLVTRPSELDGHEADECIIGSSSEELEELNDVSLSPSDNLVVVPLWYEVLRDLLYVSIIIIVIMWLKKHIT